MHVFKKGSYLYYALSNGMFYFAWGVFYCMMSVYLAGIGCSSTQISLITSAAPLFAMVTQPICGMLADRYRSPKKVGVICLMLSLITGYGFAMTKNFLLLFLFNGFAQGFLYGATPLSDRLATGSRYPFGSIRIWGSVCYAVACQVTGIVYDQFSPYAIYDLFYAAMFLAVIGFLGMHDTKPEKKEETTFSKEEIKRALFKNKPFVMFVLIFILFQGPTTANGVYMPLLITHMGGNASMIGTTLLLATLFEMPAVLFSDSIIRRIPYRFLMIFACLISIIRFVWYATCPPAKLIMSMFFFQGLTSIVFTLVAVRIIIDIVDSRYVNTAYGISSMLARGLSALAFQMLSGVIFDHVPGNQGYMIVYLIYALTILFALILAIRFKMPEHTIHYVMPEQRKMPEQ